MTPSLKLRSPVIHDAPVLVPLLAELGYAVPEATVRANIANLANGPADRAWVAENSDSILGLVSVHLTPLFHATGHLGRITSLVVRSDARSTGVGRLLMQRAQDFCWEAGCERIELTSSDHREGAHRFYERLGFQVHSRRFLKHRASSDHSSTDASPRNGV